jgi:FkbM family methyltransferase
MRGLNISTSELTRETYNLAKTILNNFPRSLPFTLTSLPFILLRELTRITIRGLKLRHELFYLKAPRWIKLPFFLPDGKLMIWEVRDFRYLLTAREVYIDHYYDLRKLRSKLNIIIDAGAHVGFFTLYASNFLNADGKIIALEPSPQNFSRLIRHLKLNRKWIKGKILPLPFALTDRNGEALLEITEDSETHHITKSPRKAVKCKATTIPSLIRLLKLSHVDILKLDVEGAEHSALKVMKTATILRKGLITEILAELHGHLEERLNLIEHLKSLGYSLECTHGEITTKIHAHHVRSCFTAKNINLNRRKVFKA